MAAHNFSPPWQSFVDCLSTVLLIMVFFSIVLVILVSVLSYSISKKEMDSAQTSEQQQTTTSAETTTYGENPELGTAKISSLLNTGEDRFIIHYDNLLSEATPEAIEELNKWIKERDPSNRKNISIIQEVVVDNISASDRRNIAFKRYYSLSRYFKTVVGNQNVIKSLSVIKGDVEQNRAIIFFKE